MDGVSIVVCCYNSASRIGATLAHLAKQNTGGISWEVIVVNNASTDNTDSIVKAFQNDVLRHRLILVHQPKPGHTHAKSMGVSKSRYDVVVFCDDDNHLDEFYIRNAYEVMQDPDIVVACGHGRAFSGEEFPEWFGEAFPYYACHEVAGHSEWMAPSTLRYGAGMAVRHSFLNRLEKIGYELVLSGRKGGSLISGEDTELMLLATIAGAKVVSAKGLHFNHFVPASRLTKSYFNRLVRGVAIGGIKLEPYRVHMAGGTLNNISWAKDTAYCACYLARNAFRLLAKRTFANEIALRMSWYGFIGALSNFNCYGNVAQKLKVLK